MKLSWSFFIVVIVQPIFIFKIYSFQIAPVVSEDLVLQKFGADCIGHHTSWLLFRFQSHYDVWVLLAYLGAVANYFICNQWERTGIKETFISMISAILDQRQISVILL